MNKSFIIIYFFLSSLILSAQQVILIPVKDALTLHGISGTGQLYSCKDTVNQIQQIFGNSDALELVTGLPPDKYKFKIYATKPEITEGKKRYVVDMEYDPEWIEFEITPGMANPCELPPVYLSRHKTVDLQEVTVTASKVMFYNKGDTLIYNADAFVLAEGSMLDALIAQLPGVELRRNGVIYCNGERIDNLLLNGKDLFNGNNELMLQNLGAYTVKDIAVYDKSGRTSELMDMPVAGDKKHVMDVRLKREYSHGFIVNFDGGYGTKDKYLARLFSMWFSDNVSATLTAGMNNLSDYNTPGQNTAIWSPSQMKDNVATRKFAGLTYNANGDKDVWTLKGGINISDIDATTTKATQRTNFLPINDTYDYIFNEDLDHELKVGTSHSFYSKLGSRANLNISPSFNYEHINNSNNSASLTLRDKMTDISRSTIYNIYNNSDSAAYVINRQLRDNLTKKDSYEGKFEASSDIKLSSKENRSMLTINLASNYNSESIGQFKRFNINTGPELEPSNHESQYINGKPTNSFELRPGLVFTQFFNYHMIQLPIKYDFVYRRNTTTSNLYLLNELNNYTPEKYPIGTLPPLIDLPSVFDQGLSYQIKEKAYEHTISFVPQHYVAFNLKGENPYLFVANAGAFLTLSHKSLDYYHYSGIQTRKSNFALWDSYISFHFFKYSVPAWNYFFQARLSSFAPSMINFITLPVTDPMNIIMGNPDLTTSKEYSLLLRIDKTDKNKRKHLIQADYKYYSDLISMGYDYNMTTGVRTFKPRNISGNMTASGSYEFFMPFGHKKQFDFTTKTEGRYRRSVDFVGTYESESSITDVLNLPKSIVNTFTANEQLTYNWRIGMHKIGLFVNVLYNYYTSPDDGFNSFNSWTYNYGFSAIFNMGKGWSLSTDLSSYNRRGFSDNRLNTSDFVWNARISKSILKGNLTFVLDGYDLLHQLSNTTYTVDAQARTETVSNVIPSYVLFHVFFRFNRQPKKLPSNIF